MGRARGKHTDRQPTIDQEDPTARGIGASPRTQGIPSPIPGGRPHLTNPHTVRHPVPVAEPRPEYRGVMAHGVPPGSHTTRERAEFMRGPDALRTGPAEHSTQKEPVVPVPVYLVERTGPKVVRSAAPRHVMLQASTGEPVRVCGVEFGRVRVGLLNESQSSDIRFAQRYSDCTAGGGALLPWPANTYTWIDTQDELYAISADSGTPTLSIITVFEQQW